MSSSCYTSFQQKQKPVVFLQTFKLKARTVSSIKTFFEGQKNLRENIPNDPSMGLALGLKLPYRPEDRRIEDNIELPWPRPGLGYLNVSQKCTSKNPHVFFHTHKPAHIYFMQKTAKPWSKSKRLKMYLLLKIGDLPIAILLLEGETS